ncbi:hypothetical protein QBC39DRAFT_289774 [Podospora conica]|nr:hypothetical protein QBC39DRAFT_289774 [Schizothecium conicum]
MISLTLLAALPALASAHGLVSSPAFTRQPGAATAAVCGTTMVKFYQADGTSYPEALMRANPNGLHDGYDSTKCNLHLCKGFQFGDVPAANVQTYAAGTEVAMEVKVRIAHTGYANVSVVDTGRNAVIGEMLKVWESGYAASTTLPGDQGKFSVKVPELGGRCVEAGACVLQWHWWGQGQTYQSCIDFVQPVAEAAAPGGGHAGHKRGIRGGRRN